MPRTSAKRLRLAGQVVFLVAAGQTKTEWEAVADYDPPFAIEDISPSRSFGGHNSHAIFLGFEAIFGAFGDLQVGQAGADRSN
jgi:hypothetical protein